MRFTFHKQFSLNYIATLIQVTCILFQLSVIQLLAQSASTPKISPPVFSSNAGYVSADFLIELSHPENATIRYTLDGQDPDEQSAIYNHQPFTLKNGVDNKLRFIQTTPPEGELNGFDWISPGYQGDVALIVRAKAFQDGFEPSETVTATFLNSEKPHDFPVISIVTDAKHLFSDATGIYVPGDVYNESGWNYDDFWGRPNANYHQRGIEWERPASIELIENGTVHQQNIGIRIHGGGSRVLPQKSFRLYSRSDYGESRFRYDMFQDGETGYNRLILRNSGQDFYQRPTMFIDALSQALVSSLSFDTQKFRAFAVYVNGEYWGIKNLRERYDQHYIRRNYGIDEHDLDLLTNRGNAKIGSDVHYNAILDSLETRNVNELGGMEFIERHIDVRNFTEYLASQIYFSNIDWPGNNNDYWRFSGTPESRGSYKDGRYRWMMYDMDYGFSYFSRTGYRNNLFEHLLTPEQTRWSNHPRSTLLIRSFLENRDFRDYYINLQLDLLNTLFKAERVERKVEEFREMYRSEISNHIDRWGYPAATDIWESLVDDRVEFARQRPSYLRQQIIQLFNAGTLATILIRNPDTYRGTVELNTIRFSESSTGAYGDAAPWEGIYLSDIPIELAAVAKPGYQFDKWEIDGEILYHQKVNINPRQAMEIEVHFSEIPDPIDEHLELLYFWYFDDTLPNDTPLFNIQSSYSSTGYTAMLNYRPAVEYTSSSSAQEAAGMMDRVNDPIHLNYRPEGNSGQDYSPDQMRGIRVRNPSLTDYGHAAIILEIPTAEFQDIILIKAARRTIYGQEKMVYSYSTSSGEPEWKQDGLINNTFDTGLDYDFYLVDFTGITGHLHNPYFRIKITFDGDNVSGFDGNTRFNNIAVFGSPYTGPRIEDIKESRLKPNFPNPFTDITTITYEVPVQSQVKIDVFSLEGRRILTLIDSDHLPGFYSIPFSGRGLAAGVYLVRLQTSDSTHYQKILLVR
ncbi:MAG: T9SS C-terminal target domain-containing protein [Balneolaceae bacterium]|nr:MAG: T9SS C-terminal target domain-containing protein [Balneolaceae bacterium]